MRKSIYSDNNKKLLDLLKKTRNDKGITQLELADKLSKPQSFVSKIESGERRLDLVELEHICNALNVDLVEFTKLYREL